MMNALQFRWWAVLVFLLSFLLSCKKEGCTDQDATNFNQEAKKDDGSCQYESSKVFWYNESTSTALIDDGATTLTYYVNGSIIGSSAANVFWTSQPQCGQDGSITKTLSLGDQKTQSYSYLVEDQTGWVYWSGVLNWNAATCEAVELTP